MTNLSYLSCLVPTEVKWSKALLSCSSLYCRQVSFSWSIQCWSFPIFVLFLNPVLAIYVNPKDECWNTVYLNIHSPMERIEWGLQEWGRCKSDPSVCVSQNIDKCRSQELKEAHRRMNIMKILSGWEWPIPEGKYLYLHEIDQFWTVVVSPGPHLWSEISLFLLKGNTPRSFVVNADPVVLLLFWY